MSNAPTSAGEMIGYLRLDPSDWSANTEKVKAEAKELGRLNPSIKIDVDSAKALTQLAAVAAATKKLQDAQGNVSVAQSKLTDLQSKGEQSASKLAAATENLAKAQRAEQLASIQLAAAHENVTKASNDAESATTKLGKSAADTGLSFSQLLGPAIGAAAIAIGPLLAVGAAGLGTLLLGVSGLKTEVLQGLTPAFNDLEKEAASALGPGITDALDQVRGALPQLTPLIQVFGAEIGKDADQFARWLNDGGVKTFAEYAEQELPVVENLFKNTAVAAGVFFKATQGYANDLLNSTGGLLSDLSSIAKLNSSIPKVPTSAGGTKGFFEGIGSALTGNPGGAEHSGSILGGEVSHLLSTGGSKAGSAISSGAKDFVGLFQNKTHGPAPSLTSRALSDATARIPGELGPSLDSETLNKATSGLGDAQGLVSTAAALGTTVTAYQSAATAAAAFKDQTAQSTLEMQAENNAAGLLAQSLQGLGGNSLGVAQTNTSFHASITALTASLQTNGTTLDINTAKGQANQQAIQAAVSAAQAHSAAIAQQTGSTKEATDAYNADIDTLEKQFGATGNAKSAIDAYIGSIDAIPAVKSTQLDVDTQLNITANLLDTYNLGTALHNVVNDISAGQSQAKAPVKKAFGGQVSGPGSMTSDSILARLSNKEYVVQAKYAQMYLPELDALNSGKGLPAVPVPAGNGGAQIVVQPSAGMDERAIGMYAATYLNSQMV